jgi:hypothetical protein
VTADKTTPAATEARAEALENDAAALTILLRLAEYGARCCDPAESGLAVSDIPNLYSDGAAAFEPSAVVEWVKERLSGCELDAVFGLREMMEAPEVAPLRALLVEALDYEREAFETDEGVEGGDLCEWFSEWRDRVKVVVE